MNLNKSKSIKKSLLFLVFVLIPVFSFSQETDSTKKIKEFSGVITVNNNGISLVPTFSLNKPATTFGLAMGGRLTFEPQFWFGLDGKPWAFLLWGRYKLLNTNKFKLNIGAHPGFLFSTMSVLANGNTNEIIRTQRFLATEISPNYFLTKNISVGMYYLYSHGLQEDATNNIHFLTVNTNFSDIPLFQNLYLRFNPQFYYLKMDKNDGIYFTSTLTLAKRNFPLSIQTIVNQMIKTNIVSKDFVWNVSLVYSFQHKYRKIK